MYFPAFKALIVHIRKNCVEKYPISHFSVFFAGISSHIYFTLDFPQKSSAKKYGVTMKFSIYTFMKSQNYKEDTPSLRYLLIKPYFKYVSISDMYLFRI